MSFCSSCGTKILENQKFCPNCGQKVVENQSPDKCKINISAKKVPIPIVVIIIIAMIAVIGFIVKDDIADIIAVSKFHEQKIESYNRLGEAMKRSMEATEKK